MDYNTIGSAGFANLFVLASVVIWRWYIYNLQVRNARIKNSYKKQFAFVLLLVASCCNLPMYATFFTLEEYHLNTYSYHKFEGAALFGAYSLVISDWSIVLFEIREDTLAPFLLRNVSLLAVNAILTTISIVNFVYCYSVDSLDLYADSKVYIIAIFIQIIAPFCITCLMLHAGLKLSWRIQGASGTGGRSQDRFKNEEFRSAIFHLNIVMISVCIAIFIQITLYSLNFYYGYHNSTDETVGPGIFYFTFSEWAPLWVLTLAQLYLCRTSPSRSAGSSQITKSSQIRGTTVQYVTEAGMGKAGIQGESQSDDRYRESSGGGSNSQRSRSDSASETEDGGSSSIREPPEEEDSYDELRSSITSPLLNGSDEIFSIPDANRPMKQSVAHQLRTQLGLDAQEDSSFIRPSDTSDASYFNGGLVYTGDLSQSSVVAGRSKQDDFMALFRPSDQRR